MRLKTFEKFNDTADALDNISAIVDGKVSTKLASLLTGLEDKSGSLIVSDPKLGGMYSIHCLTLRNGDKSNSKAVLRNCSGFFDGGFVSSDSHTSVQSHPRISA